MRNRERVVAAAEEVFSEQGKELQMKEVAERAGVAVGTVYRAFPSKEALVGAIAALQFERCLDRADEVLAAEGPEAALRVFLAQLAVMFQGSGAELRDLLSELPTEHRPSEQGNLLPRLSSLHQAWSHGGVLRRDLNASDLRALVCGLSMTVACGMRAETAAEIFFLAIRQA